MLVYNDKSDVQISGAGQGINLANFAKRKASFHVYDKELICLLKFETFRIRTDIVTPSGNAK